MRTFHLDTSTWIAVDIDRVFHFFAQAENLQRLTPPFLNFRIMTPLPIAIEQGTTIDYRLSLRGVPITWRSEITAWDPPRRFVDEQRKGPYRMWKHTHTFEASDGGTLVRDRVEYATWGGSIVNRLFVAPELRRIFEYRRSMLERTFDSSETR
jgi:ligand-binding SRPBCC domain-containing protein